MADPKGLVAAWAVWRKAHPGLSLGPGPGFQEAIEAYLEAAWPNETAAMLNQVVVDIATELGCAPDNDEILLRIATMREREAAMVAFVLRCSAENPAAIGSAVGKAAALLERFGIEPRAPGVFYHTAQADENDARAALFDAKETSDD